MNKKVRKLNYIITKATEELVEMGEVPLHLKSFPFIDKSKIKKYAKHRREKPARRSH